MLKKFKDGDLLLNEMKLYPKVEFFANSGSVGSIYHNRKIAASGSVPGSGHITLSDFLPEPIVVDTSIPDDYYMWLSARDVDGTNTGNAAYSDGERISFWTPVTGSVSGSFVQALAARQPLYYESELNGQPAISFDEDGSGVEEKVVSDQLPGVWKRFHTDPWTMFVVVKQYGQDPESSQWLISNEEGAISGRRGFGISLRRSTNDGSPEPPRDTDRTIYTYVLNSTDTDFINVTSENEAYEYNEIMLLKVKMDFSTNNELHKDGTLVQTSGAVGSPYTANPSVNELVVGGRSRNNTSWLSGAIGDILLFDRLTTEQEDSSIEAYFQQIYGDFSGI